MTVTIVAPTDAQLGYIASLCREHGLQQPVVYSKREATEIIAMRGGTYDPERYRLDAGLPEPLSVRRERERDWLDAVDDEPEPTGAAPLEVPDAA